MSDPATAIGSGPASMNYPDAEAFLADLQMLALRLKQVAGLIDDGPLAPAARAVLESLHHQGSQTVPQLGRARGTSRQNSQVIVNRLVSQGFVELGPNPAHKRSDLAKITAKGADLLRNSADPQQQLSERLAREISATDLAHGRMLFERLGSLLSQVVGSERGEPKQEAGFRHSPPVSKAIPENDNELPVNLL